MSRAEALREPPHAIDAEQNVLGALMIRPDSINLVSDWLTDGDFYRRDHRIIYRAIFELAAADKPHDAVTIGEWLEANNLAGVVKVSYATDIASNVASAANVVAYAEIVVEKSKLRKAIDLGTELAGKAFEARGTSAELLANDAMQGLAQLVGNARATGPQAAKAAVNAWYAELHARYERKEQMSGVVTPWKDINEDTLGWQRGELILIAGRPSMGKSIMGFQAGVFNALRGGRTLGFSLEMRASQVVQRAVSGVSEVLHEYLRRPASMPEDQWPMVSAATGRIAASSFDIDDQSGLTAPQICARAKRHHMRAPLSLVVIDHLHEVRLPGKDNVNELTAATRAFKALAKELNVPVILLLQINRGAATRTDHRPTLSDLRGSGGIEEVADVVLLMHREEYYNRSTHLKGVVEIILAKGRDLPAGETRYLLQRYDLMRLDDWEGPLPTAKSAAANDDDLPSFDKASRVRSRSGTDD